MTSLLCTILAPLAFVAALLFGSAVCHVASSRHHSPPAAICLRHRAALAPEQRCQVDRLPRSVGVLGDFARWN
jgi:hypothetical protein